MATFSELCKCEIMCAKPILPKGEAQMKESRANRKARMMEKAEKLIEAALDWAEKTDKPNLTQIEDSALRVRQEIGQMIAQEMIDAQEAKRPVPGPACPSCGREMRYKDLKEVNPLTWVGKVKIERGYYHCPNCKESLFPPR